MARKSGKIGNPELKPADHQEGGTGGRATTGWLRFFLLAALLGGLIGGAVPSCVVADAEYCATRAQCPFVDTDFGSVQLLCHPRRHVCVNGGEAICFTDGDCDDYKNPRCDTTTNTCTACRVGDTSDTSCAHLPDRKLCVSAPDGSESTLCVACLSNIDCPAASPICDNQQCRKCASHKDCEGKLKCAKEAECTDSLVCIQQSDPNSDPLLIGRCAQNGTGASGQVVYVNKGAGCSDVTNTGANFSTPLCSLAAGLTMAKDQGRRYIRLVGPLDAPSTSIQQIMSGSYSFIGAPAKDTKDMASISLRGELFQVTGSTSLTLDSLNIHEINPRYTVLRCVGVGTSPTFTLRNSILTGETSPLEMQSSVPAISLNSCHTIIDGNVIGATTVADTMNAAPLVHATAISVQDSAPAGTTSYLIQNNIIAGNAGSALTLATDSGLPTVIIRFNTIVGNCRSASCNAAVICPRLTDVQEFSHSIVAGNKLVGGTQFPIDAPHCKLKDLVVGTAEMGTGPGYVHVDPIFDATFHLQASSDCCIDKVMPIGTEILPSLDFEGIARPQGSKWDIGASERKP